MIDINKAISEQGNLKQLLLELMSPQVYQAENIADFLGEREKIKVTPFHPVLYVPKMNVYSILHICEATNFNDGAVIIFKDVKFSSNNGGCSYIEDKTGKIKAYVDLPSVLDEIMEDQEISNGDNVQLVGINAKRNYDVNYLLFVHKSSQDWRYLF